MFTPRQPPTRWPRPVLYETHTHSPLCGHAIGEPEEYAQAAYQRGLAGLTVTCHNPMPDGFAADARMDIEQFAEYQRLVERARQAWSGKVDVLLGLECDFFPGTEAWIEQQLQSAPIHHVLGSIHPQFPEYTSRFYDGDAVQFQKMYFEHLAQAAETKLFDTLTHPDLIKNMTPDQWDLGRILDHVRRCLDRIARAGVAMELNTSGLMKEIPEMNPGRVMLQEMQKRQIPVVIGSDAHVPQRVGEHFEQAIDLLQSVGYRHTHHFINRQLHHVDLAEAKASLL